MTSRITNKDRISAIEASIESRPDKLCPDCNLVKKAIEFNPLNRGGSIREVILKEHEKYMGEALSADGLSCICFDCFQIYLNEYPNNVQKQYQSMFKNEVRLDSSFIAVRLWSSMRKEAVIDAIKHELTERNNNRKAKGLEPIGKIGLTSRLAKSWSYNSMKIAREFELNMIGVMS